MTYVVAALYHFADLSDYADWQAPLQQLCAAEQIRGTLLLAAEGINGTVAGPRAGIDRLLARLRADPRLAGLKHKESISEQPPFRRLKVRLKQEIVSLGVPGTDPNQRVGEYVDPATWNALLDDPEVTVIDTRNQYEVDIGSFPGAVSPGTDSFRQFPDFVARELDPAQHRKVAMFCTGGIRCEKASSYLLDQGFESVYHLDGGILQYLEDAPADDNRWQGECFVFDDRVAVDADLAPGSHKLCHGCRRPVSPEQQASEQYQPGICCPQCHDQLTEAQRERFTERQRQVELARVRKRRHGSW